MIVDKMCALKHLTVQEQAVVDYILDNPRALVDMSINELAHASATSSSTVMRLCKKLGFKGYSELRFIYACDYPEIIKQREMNRIEPFDAESSIDDIMEKLPFVYMKSIDFTKSVMSRNTIIRVTNMMKNASRIEIYGAGVNYDLGRMIAYKFDAVHKDCVVYNASHWEHIKYLEMSKIPTLAILISHTGKNPTVLEAAARLKRSGIKTVSITSDNNSKLSQITDEHIHIINRETELEFKTTSFTIAIQFVLDLCVSSILVHNIKDIETVNKGLKGEREKW